MAKYMPLFLEQRILLKNKELWKKRFLSFNISCAKKHSDCPEY